MTPPDLFDPKGLIKDAFAIEGISEPECRSIFLDWVLGVPQGDDVQSEVARLIAHYAALHSASHPMLVTLQATRDAPIDPKRRGGRKTRLARRQL